MEPQAYKYESIFTGKVVNNVLAGKGNHSICLVYTGRVMVTALLPDVHIFS